MEQLALLLAKRVIDLDPQAAPRLLWEAAKLYRQTTDAEERQKLLDFQANLCRMIGRPLVAAEAEQHSVAARDTEFG